ncbi:hypothetical protein CPLU01_02176 [Colletotrichum plurivorum]|uniref:Uncharacterized protein n=1 Tax=Colletotrichum plurivorum TaxID=2175906 RepID=A0A8H6NND7_9PEZI|nr:hypothetical protein CPLU01_02176 [Colletotrichum plurivorum]
MARNTPSDEGTCAKPNNLRLPGFGSLSLVVGGALAPSSFEDSSEPCAAIHGNSRQRHMEAHRLSRDPVWNQRLGAISLWTCHSALVGARSRGPHWVILGFTLRGFICLARQNDVSIVLGRIPSSSLFTDNQRPHAGLPHFHTNNHWCRRRRRPAAYIEAPNNAFGSRLASAVDLMG